MISKYKKFYNIKFSKNSRNLGLGVNILKSVSLASGEYVWIIGNDDLLLENTLFKLNELFELHKDVDFFYINSFHMDSTLLHKYKFPFDTNNIKKLNLKKFSKSRTSKKLNFFELINPSLSFDFLLGMFLCIFKKKNWDQNLFIIDEKKISDLNVYSTFDNTWPHIKIWARAFKNKKAFFKAKPLSINLSGERGKDWGYLYPFVEAVRIPEVVDCFRNNGMSLPRYIYCKNFAVRKLLFNLIKILIFPSYKGIEYIELRKHIINNLIYPSIYIAPIFYIIRKIFKETKILIKR